ncbi:hypothetical protein MKL09_09620 [Methylobacterium sp. J-048]|uniref:hypothetical protein n=1 Tax=Methylobacterium sp. J-048 TaxID=2836635 RepID=UPI001FBB7480|nr:hypothetical protein [Methylobacterium sp. J-048]MCJ2056813.1 hypothetical protein [Methylobacterium sp. J-048]
MTETDTPRGESAVPPTAPIRNIKVPATPEGREPEGQDLVKTAERAPDDPDKAAEDGLA